MQQYNYLQAIYRSFYSKALYRDVKNNWGAGVVLYLLLVLAICWAAMMVDFQKSINVNYNQFAKNILPQLPVVHIKNGQATTAEKHPYFIMNPDNQRRIMVIDTTGQFRNLDEANTNVLLTKQELMVKYSENETRIQKIPESLTINLVPEMVHEKLSGMIHLAWIILFPIALLLAFIYRLLQAVIYAVLGKLFALLADNSMSYVNILKLSIVAVTPAIIISAIFRWFNIMFPFQWLCFFILTMAYLIFAIQSNKD